MLAVDKFWLFREKEGLPALEAVGSWKKDEQHVMNEFQLWTGTLATELQNIIIFFHISFVDNND